MFNQQIMTIMDKRFEFNDKQRAIIEQINQLLDEATKEKIFMYYSPDEGCILLTNVEKFEDYDLVEDHNDGDGWAEIPDDAWKAIYLWWAGDFHTPCVK